MAAGGPCRARFVPTRARETGVRAILQPCLHCSAVYLQDFTEIGFAGLKFHEISFHLKFQSHRQAAAPVHIHSARSACIHTPLYSSAALALSSNTQELYGKQDKVHYV